MAILHTVDIAPDQRATVTKKERVKRERSLKSLEKTGTKLWATLDKIRKNDR